MTVDDPNTPRRFRRPIREARLPSRGEGGWQYGCYFPWSDLVVTDLGARRTGVPDGPGLEWLDDAPAPAGAPAMSPAIRTPPTMDEMLGPGPADD